MENKCIFGKVIADRIDLEISEFVLNCKEKRKRIPKLVNIQVGNNDASSSYIKTLVKKTEKVGIELELVHLDETISEFELIRLIHRFNQSISIDGILIQMPLPKHINKNTVALEIDPNKDVDGIHPLNVGYFYQGLDAFLPCTAVSVMEFIKEAGVNLEGKEVVVVGRSNVIGRPVAQLCLNEHASVTIVHSRSKDIQKICARADVIIAAAGVAKMIKKEWVKENALIIDVGINFDENGKMCGDVDFDDVIEKVSKISPVPKGVGVVTNSILLRNTIKSYNRRG